VLSLTGFRRRTTASGTRGGSAAPPTVEPRETVVVVNPLGAALHHYQAELVSVLSGLDRRIICLETVEPHVSGRSRAAWLLRYLVLLVRAALRVRGNPPGRVISVWPVLGYLDLVLLRFTAGRRGRLVLHDPTPLVWARGYGRAARWLGRTLGGGVGVIVHSRAARAALDAGISERRVSLLPHPMLPSQPVSPEPTRSARTPTVRVLGQYKPDRDVDALRRLARNLGPTADLHVHGRGWPEIQGWSVHPYFVLESEMESLISSSDVVLVPYRRFFQSGVAIRCLEHGTPVVGPADTSLEELYGGRSPLLVRDPDDWVRAVHRALAEGGHEAVTAGRAWRTRCEQEWSGWAERSA
jgi:glycosyltransferase involved in cell wall biosynthesis